MSDEINHKLDKISEDVADIKVQSAIQNLQLKEHMHRTELLEERVTPIELKIGQVSAVMRTLLGIIAFFAGLPHAERLFHYLLSLFH